MFINTGIRKTRNTWRLSFLVQVRHFLLPFWVKGFSSWGERVTQFLSMLTFPSDPTTCGTRQKLQVWPRRAPKIDLLRGSHNFNCFFFLNSKILSTTKPKGKIYKTKNDNIKMFINQFCAVTSCRLEESPRAMTDRNGWFEKVDGIRAISMTCWWWWWSW